MTLARNLVLMHDGTLAARSDGLGKGTEFVMTLPYSKNPLPAGTASPSAAPKAPGHARRILVVDDNLASADSLGLIIKLWGHECRVSHSGPDAIQEASVFHPDIVLLDIGLPGMDGYEVAQALRSRPGSNGVILLAMTGYGREEDRKRSRESGFDQHLVKPLDLDALEEILAHIGGTGPGGRLFIVRWGCNHPPPSARTSRKDQIEYSKYMYRK